MTTIITKTYYDPTLDIVIIKHLDEEHMLCRPIGTLPLDIVWSDGETLSLTPDMQHSLFAHYPDKPAFIVHEAKRAAA